jgi:cyclophilin family peptidyl-prolyl cis-trans isomerase
MRTSMSPVLISLAIASATGVVLSHGPRTRPPNAPRSAANAIQQTGLDAAARARLLDPDAPEFTEEAPARSIVRLETTRGNVEIAVTRAWAPRGADRFINLVRHGYYDGARFFRVTVGRWVQFGVNGDPAIAQAWRGATFPDDPFRESNVRGTVAFAFAEPNGRTTQVFVNMRDNAATHDAEPFVPFGRIVAGMDVLDGLNAEHGEGPGGIRAGGQDPFFAGGNAWLDDRFPRLDAIRRAVVRN